MNDYISRQVALDALKGLEFSYYMEWGEDIREVSLIRAENAQHAIQKLPSADVVPMETYKQAAWERDVAEKQLKILGYSIGEKVVTCMHCKYVMEPKNDIRRPRCFLHDCTEVEWNGFCKWGKFKEV